MGGYVLSTDQQRKEMLSAIGLKSEDQLYASVPDSLKIEKLNLPSGKPEMEVRRILEETAGQNQVFSSVFRGAGAYRHYIPSIVKGVSRKEEFVTAYTPYQAEISQGILQSIFEYQTMICGLMGMDVSNASVYDGATAAAEGISMCRDAKRKKALVASNINPMVMETLKTYSAGMGIELLTVPAEKGTVDIRILKTYLDENTACFYVQQPNFYGLLEDCQKIGEAVHDAGAKFIMGINPIAASVLKSPGECGADVAVGEGQPLGQPLAFGGPYLGIMTCRQSMVRKLPGRIVGETRDSEGRKAYVLTLQAREQHIRREKASSNICSNQAHCALTASVFMASMGPEGMKEMGVSCYSKARYGAEQISQIPGFSLRYKGDFFHEFVTECPGNPERVLDRLMAEGILGGYPVEGGLLWCFTEMNTKAEIDRLVQCLKEVA